MAFEYKLSNAFSVSGKKDAQGNDIIVLEYKYVRFELTLDDVAKREVLERIITGKVERRAKERDPVKMPTMYGGRL
jgi:hypothetical protein